MSKNTFVLGVIVGAGLGAAGGVLLQKNSRRIKAKLMYMKMRADLERQLRGLKKFTREAHDKLVENALKEYAYKAGVSAAKLGLVEMELKSRWKEAKERFAEGQEKARELEDEQEDDDE